MSYIIVFTKCNDIVMNKGTLLIEKQQATQFSNTSSNDVVIRTTNSNSRIHISPFDLSNNTAVMSIGKDGVEINTNLTIKGTEINVSNTFNALNIAGVVHSNSNIIAKNITTDSITCVSQITSCNWQLDYANVHSFKLNKYPNYRNVLTVTSNGNTGLGTEMPTEKLHVNGNGLLTSNLTVLGDINLYSRLLLGGSQVWSVTGSSNESFNMLDANVYNNVNVIRNIGMGVLYPSARLHISSENDKRKIVLSTLSNQNSNQFVGLGTSNTTMLCYQVTSSNYDHVFLSGESATSSKELMRVRGTGVVNIPGSLNCTSIVASNIQCSNINISQLTLNALYLRTDRYVYAQGENPLYSNIDIAQLTTTNALQATDATIVNVLSSNVTASNILVVQDIQVLGDIYTRSNDILQGGASYTISNLVVINDANLSNNLNIVKSIKFTSQAADNIILYGQSGFGASNSNILYQSASSHIFNGGALTINSTKVDARMLSSALISMSNEAFFTSPSLGKAGFTSNHSFAVYNRSLSNEYLSMGYSATYNGGFIQCMDTSNIHRPLFLSPNNGTVCIGTVMPSFNDRLRVDSQAIENPTILLAQSASASSTFSGSSFSNAFDKSSSTFWKSNGFAPQNITYQYKRRVLAQYYSIQNSVSVLGSSPKTWILQGSLNGTVWTDIDQQANVGWASLQHTNSYPIFKNGTLFSYYRLNIIESQASNTFIEITEFRVFTTTPCSVSTSGFISVGKVNPSHHLDIFNGNILLDSDLDSNARQQNGLYMDVNKNYGIEKQVDSSGRTFVTFLTDSNNGGFSFKQVKTAYDSNDQGKSIMTLTKRGFVGVGADTQPTNQLDVRGSIQVQGSLFKCSNINPINVTISSFVIGGDSTLGTYMISKSVGGASMKSNIGPDGIGYMYVIDTIYTFKYSVASEQTTMITYSILESTSGQKLHDLLPSMMNATTSIVLYSIITAIASNGKIGVNTSIPSTYLDVNGDAYLASNVNVGSAIGIGLSSVDSTPTGQLQLGNTLTNKKIVLYDTTSNNHQFVGLGFTPSNECVMQIPDSSSQIKFRYGTSPLTSSDMFTIAPSNSTMYSTFSLGIGYQIPLHRLHCDGNIYAVSRSNADVSIVVQNNSFTPFGMRTDEGNGMTIGALSNGPSMYFAIKNTMYGNFGVNTNVAAATLHIVSDDTNSCILHQMVNGEKRLRFGHILDNSTGIYKSTITSECNSSGWTSADIAINPSGGNVSIGTANALGYKLYVSGTTFSTGGYQQTSDRRMKYNLEPIENALDKIERLTGYTYNFAGAPTNERYTGLVAQDVECVLPEVVKTNSDDVKSIAYGDMMGLIVEALKALRTEIRALKIDKI